MYKRQVVSVAAWTIVTMTIVFLIIKKTIGLRVSSEEEIKGLDATAVSYTHLICLVPVTGRPLSGIPQCVLQLGVCDYAVTTNGAVIPISEQASAFTAPLLLTARPFL